MKIVGIIPARLRSTRLPNKALVDIEGLPMIVHVFKRAELCRALDEVIVATDSQEIFDTVTENGGKAVMTSSSHQTGTDRIAEVAGKIDADIVVNIQGDEPALDPNVLTLLIEPFKSPDVKVTTPVRKMNDPEEIKNTDRVKVVFSKKGNALYFTRSPIPFSRDGKNTDYYLHIGIYAFRMGTLKEFVDLPPSKLEQTERLEQLRLLENDIPIRVVETDYRSVGVDRPEDIALVEKLLAK